MFGPVRLLNRQSLRTLGLSFLLLLVTTTASKLSSVAKASTYISSV